MYRIATFVSGAALMLATPALAQSVDGVPYNWTGAYVGVNAGYGGGRFKYPFYGTTDAAGTNPVAGQARQSSSGPIGGVQAGVNLQGFRGLLFGVETDIDSTDIRGQTQLYSADAAGTTTAGNLDSRIEYLGTVRGRIGAPLFDGRVLPYVTGGFAYGGVKNRADYGCSACGDAGGLDFGTQIQTGWTAGGGVEFALARHLSFKVEYLYADLGRRDLTNDYGYVSAPNVGLYNADLQEKADLNTVRAGINFRF